MQAATCSGCAKSGHLAYKQRGRTWTAQDSRAQKNTGRHKGRKNWHE